MLFCAKFMDISRFSNVNLMSSFITALQPRVTIAKEIFPFATATNGWKEMKIIELSN